MSDQEALEALTRASKELGFRLPLVQCEADPDVVRDADYSYVAGAEHAPAAAAIVRAVNDLPVHITEITTLREQLYAKTLLAANLGQIVTELKKTIASFQKPRPRAEYHEDHGEVLWWKLPVVEAPYVGREDDDDFPDYVTHWTPLLCPEGE